MSKPKQVIIAGAGGIGRAVAILLALFSEEPPRIILANRRVERAHKVARSIKLGTAQRVQVSSTEMDLDQPSDEWLGLLNQSDLLLDCLPGRLAPRMAGLARAYGMHYANLTEHVEETRQIENLAEGADTGFVLQTGLAPGFANVLANGLFQHFCKHYGVEQVERLSLKVGALTRHATPPHYYAFTWSPAGVANEYLNPVRAIRDFETVTLPARSELETLYVNGKPYEADLTSGGSADLPEALAGKVRTLDYKTLRYPGHFHWVDKTLDQAPEKGDPTLFLQERMEHDIPRAGDDIVVIYCSVEGRDQDGCLQRLERNYQLSPQPVGRQHLRAVQAATAAPMAEVAAMLLRGELKGVVRQSQIDPEEFLGGPFVTAVYGKWNGGEDVLSSSKYKVS